MARLDGVPVFIEWQDAHAEEGWTTLSELGCEPYLVRTVGFLLPDAKPGHLVIVQSIGSDDGLDAIISIPVGMVLRTTLLGNPPQTNTESLES
jgi:hypothetical protein